MKRIATLMMAMFLVAGIALADAADAGRSLSVRTFQFKHKQADAAAAVIKDLMTKDGSMAIQPAANSLTVTDQPEALKRIVSALAAFDKPAQPMTLSVRLVSAGRVAPDAAHVDAGLNDVASKLALLKYNALASLGAAEVEGREGDPTVVDLNGYRAEFKFGEYDPSSDSVEVIDFRLSRVGEDQVAPLFKSTLNLKLGQTVIIGATKQPQSQRALMIVFAAKR